MHTILALGWDVQKNFLPLGASSHTVIASSPVLTDATLTEALWGYGDSKQQEDRVNSVVECLSAMRFCNWMQKVSLRLESGFKINRGPVRDQRENLSLSIDV